MSNPQSLINNLLFYVMIVVSVADWILAELKKKKARFVTKPLAIALIIAWFTYISHWEGQLLWFGLGLAFSMAGDIFLLFEDRFFILGMVAFLAAHVMYILGFNLGQTIPVQPESLYIILGVGIAGAVILTYVVKAMRADPKNRKMTVPVIVYGVVISLMLISAFLNLIRPEWMIEGIAGLPAAVFTCVGAAFFFASDSMLATRTFVKRFNHDEFMVISTYHIGQILLVAGALMHFLK